jgi:hypothetical protein
MGVQDAIRWLLPREDHFFDLTAQQGEVLQRAAAALATYRAGGPPAEELAKQVQSIEHEGDKLLHAVEDALVKTSSPLAKRDPLALARRDPPCDHAIDRATARGPTRARAPSSTPHTRGEGPLVTVETRQWCTRRGDERSDPIRSLPRAETQRAAG